MKYVTKPFEIEAMRYYNDGESFEKIQKWVGTHETPNGHVHPNFDHASNWVMNDENISAVVWDYLHQTWVGVRLGDYIIKGMKGEFYPCDPEVFNSKYEPSQDNLRNTNKKIITIYLKQDGNVMMYVDYDDGRSGGGITTKEQIINEVNISFNGGVITSGEIEKAIGRRIQQSSRFR